MKVLADTSVWVAHFKQRDEHLVTLLLAGLVVCHPCVVVEVACGTPPRRSEVVDMLRQLPVVALATPDELLALVHQRSLYGRGCGFVDMGLLASALLSNPVRLWTLDKRLDALAHQLGCAYRPPLAS